MVLDKGFRHFIFFSYVHYYDRESGIIAEPKLPPSWTGPMERIEEKMLILAFEEIMQSIES